MFSYAASYFGNADAQYDLARLYLKSSTASRDDFRYGARWLGLAAQKGSIRPRPCSARCCSMATSCRLSAPAA